jgi:spore maturation protein CgeB
VDTRVFRPPLAESTPSVDLVWIGAWGNGERASELDEFLIEPIRTLGLRARFYGARYPREALHTLRSVGIDYGGWIPDFSIPAALGAGRFTINVPRRMRADGLPHTPAIRVLEALACGMPVVTAPWDECEELFTPDVDVLVARDARQVERHAVELLRDPEFARTIAANGYRTVVGRHTCGHRVQELLGICATLGVQVAGVAALETTSSELPRVQKPGGRPGQSRVPAAWN